MKAVLVILAIVGLSLAKPTPRDLADDLQDFVNLIDIDKLKEIADEHLQTDGAFVAVVLYLQGSEWQDLVQTVLSKPAVQDFVDYLNNAGLSVENIIAFIHDLIAGAEPGTEADDNGSLRPLLDEIEATLPLNDLLALLYEKLQSSEDFQNLYFEVSSDKAYALVEEVRALDEVQRLAQRLRDFGVAVDEVLAAVYAFLGWGAPKVNNITPRDLANDLQDFLNMLPLEEIVEIIDAHLQSDGAVVDVFQYLQSNKWAQLVETVKSKPAVQDFIQFLTDGGLPVENLIVFINNLIQNAVLGTEPDEAGSLRPFLDEEEDALPLTELLALVNDKLQSSTDFQKLYVKVSSEATHQLIEEVGAIDEVQRLGQRLRDMGVYVDEVLSAVYDFFGWGTPKL